MDHFNEHSKKVSDSNLFRLSNIRTSSSTRMSTKGSRTSAAASPPLEVSATRSSSTAPRSSSSSARSSSSATRSSSVAKASKSTPLKDSQSNCSEIPDFVAVRSSNNSSNESIYEGFSNYRFSNTRVRIYDNDSDSNDNNNNDDDEDRIECSRKRKSNNRIREEQEKKLSLGPRVRGRNLRHSPSISPTPEDALTNSCGVSSRRSLGRMPYRTPPNAAVSNPNNSTCNNVVNSTTAAAPSTRIGKSKLDLNGVAHLLDFQECNNNNYDETKGVAHRAGSLFLPTATWTPPSLRHFGFPKEFQGFWEVGIVQAVSPHFNNLMDIVKEDLKLIPHEWHLIPKKRRLIYTVGAVVLVYYLLATLIAIPLVLLGFLAPAWICRKFVGVEGEDEVENNNNFGEVLDSVKEMSRWLKFWVALTGWLMLTSLSPSFLAALLPLKALTMVFAIGALAAPWAMNPAIIGFDRILMPILDSSDHLVDAYKEKVIDAVSALDVRRRR